MGLDLVDDESKPERRPTKHMPTPAQWTNVFNPAFSYYVYYCYANLYTLNKVRIQHLKLYRSFHFLMINHPFSIFLEPGCNFDFILSLYLSSWPWNCYSH